MLVNDPWEKRLMPERRVVERTKQEDNTWDLSLSCGHTATSGSEKFGAVGENIYCIACRDEIINKLREE